MATAFQPQEFDMSKLVMTKRSDKISVGKNILIIGERAIGKSVLAVDILYHNQDVPLVIAVSPTDDCNHTYSPHLPEDLVCDEYTSEITKDFLHHQQELTTLCKTTEHCNVDPRGIIVLDDCMASVSFAKDPSLQFIYTNGHCANITSITAFIEPLGAPPKWRQCFDYVFIFREPKLLNRKRLYEHYAKCFPSFDLFDQVLTDNTNDYNCLVIDNTSDRILEDCVFRYKAQLHDDFHMCKNYDDEEPIEPPNSIAKHSVDQNTHVPDTLGDCNGFFKWIWNRVWA
jgi:hypothetical protein